MRGAPPNYCHLFATGRSRSGSSTAWSTDSVSDSGKATQRQARDRGVGDEEECEVQKRAADPGAGLVERGGDRLQRRLEGEERREVADRVEDGGTDSARGDEGEEGNRQGDHEGEQGDGA